MADPTMAQTRAEAAALADAIERACAGRSTVAVYMALSMVLGASATRAARPDFDGMMRLVEKAARESFTRHMKGGA